MTVREDREHEYLGCSASFCTQEVPHDCEAEWSLVALATLTQGYADRILPHVQPLWFMTPMLRGSIPALKQRWWVEPKGLRMIDLYQRAEADPSRIDHYLRRIKDCALQRKQIHALSELVERAWRAPLHDFNGEVALAQAEERTTRVLAVVDDQSDYGDIPEAA